MDPILAQIASSANIDILNGTVFNIANSSWNSASWVYDSFLNPLATAVAKGLLPLVMTVEIIFCGFRIMMGKTITEQAVKILFAALVCYVLVFRQYPQRIMRAAIQDMQEAGRATSGTMLKSQLTAEFSKLPVSQGLSTRPDVDTYMTAHGVRNDHDITPMLAWAAWVDPDNNPTSDNYKYGFVYLRNTIFANPYSKWGVAHTDWEKQAYQNLKANQSTFLTSDFFDKLWKPTGGAIDDLLKKYEGKAIDAGSMLFIMSPMTAFSYAVPIAFSIMAGVTAPMWVTSEVLAASYYSFYIVMALGVSVVPLLFFSSFTDIWKSWLKFLIGVSLIPLLYFLFCGVGFVFATSTYDVLFPAAPMETGTNGKPNQPGMSAIYGSILEESIGLAYNSNVSSDLGSLTNLANFFQDSMKLFFKITMLLGRQGAGCSIITTFILAGTAFPLAAVKMAMKWSTGFDENAVFDAVMQSFETMRGGIGTAIGQQYSTGMEVASQAIGKLTSAVTGAAIGGLLGSIIPGGGGIGAAIGGALGLLRG